MPSAAAAAVAGLSVSSGFIAGNSSTCGRPERHGAVSCELAAAVCMVGT